MTRVLLPGMVFCERCGAGIGEQAGERPHHCVECELFVCGACWDSAPRRCAACQGTISDRQSRRGGLTGARRHLAAIRRAGAELDQLAAALRDPDRREEAARQIEPAVLITVRAAAHRAEAEALLATVKGKSAARAEAISRDLRDEIVRLARLEIELVELTRDHLPVTAARVASAEPAILPPRTRRLSPRVRLAAWTIGVVALVVSQTVLFFSPTPPVGEGTLGGSTGGAGGGRSDPAASPIDTPAATSFATAQPPVAEPSPSTELAIDFDDVRMGSGIGEDWRQTAGDAGAVAVAAFPTAVDRSARLVVPRSGVVETCRSFEPPMSRVNNLSVEVLLYRATATAIMSVGVVPGDSELRVSLSASETTVTGREARVLAEGGGLNLDEWYRVEIVRKGRTTLWRVTPLDDSSPPVLDATAETGALETIGELCLAASGELQDAVYFDNLTIVTSEGG